MTHFNTPRKPLRVSDHAVLRYMERVQGFNVELVREHIFKACSAAAAIGARAVRVEGVKFEILNNTVLTVTPDGNLPSNLTREKIARDVARKREART